VACHDFYAPPLWHATGDRQLAASEILEIAPRLFAVSVSGLKKYPPWMKTFRNNLLPEIAGFTGCTGRGHLSFLMFLLH
jgi:hypothetical protein